MVSAEKRIFMDDPDAISKLEVKLVGLEKEKAYWKTITKCVPRTYENTPEDAKWYMPQNINANIRIVKRKIEILKTRKEQGITLERKTTFVGGKKRFFYKEVSN